MRDLEDQLRRKAANSFVPPSANPPGAPKPVPKKPTGRKRGAQPKHPPSNRLRLPPERLPYLVEAVCTHRAAALPQSHLQSAGR